MFRLTRPTDAEIEKATETARGLAPITNRHLFVEDSAESPEGPPGFVRDFSQTRLGLGEKAFAAAKLAFAAWVPFDLGWARVVNPRAAISVGEIVAVEVRSLGFWTVNLSRIVDVVDAPDRFGFVYSTTAMHVEQGEEKFLLRFDAATGEVRYELEAVSRPRNLLARIGYPVTRGFQHRFARDSHRRMKRALAHLGTPGNNAAIP